MKPSTSKQPLILVIDDDDAIRESLELGLSDSGEMEVLTAQSAAVGLDIARAKNPDVIVLDLNMPTGNGFDFIDKLRSEPALATTKVMMLTANASGANEWKSIDHDIDDFMAKPFDLVELEGRIKVLLSKPFGTARRF